MVKNPSASIGDKDSVLGSGRFSGGGNSNPTQCSCLEKSHDQRSLVTLCFAWDMT